MSDNKQSFPTPFRRNGRLYWRRWVLENHKRHLMGLEPLPEDPTEKIVWVPAPQVASEFGVGRRTLARWISGCSVAEAA